jgi:hypothetical protein
MSGWFSNLGFRAIMSEIEQALEFEDLFDERVFTRVVQKRDAAVEMKPGYAQYISGHDTYNESSVSAINMLRNARSLIPGDVLQKIDEIQRQKIDQQDSENNRRQITFSAWVRKMETHPE